MEQKRYLDRLYDYNHTRPSEPAKQQILHELFADLGKLLRGTAISRQLWWASRSFGANVYATST